MRLGDVGGAEDDLVDRGLPQVLDLSNARQVEATFRKEVRLRDEPVKKLSGAGGFPDWPTFSHFVLQGLKENETIFIIELKMLCL